MSCPFYNIDGLRDRLFYENDRWFAFLSAPWHTTGHAIIAERPCGSVCPRLDRSGWGDLPCFGATLGQVATALMKVYHPKDILFTSLRGDVPHFHVHMLPLWPAEEDSWRKNQGDRGDDYKTGHLMEFVGNLEKQGDDLFKRELIRRGIGKEELRREISEKLKPKVEELRKVSGYYEAQQTNSAD